MRGLGTLWIAMVVATACKKKDTEPLVTDVGTPTGEPVTAMIGPSGGSLASADGGLTIEVPAGALAADTELSITPITNETPAPIGGAYRLGPDEVALAAPVQLSFGWTADEIAGSVGEAVEIVFQRADGTWQLVDPIDRAADTVTVETDHFSDWSRLPGIQLLPGAATVHTGDSLTLKVVVCQYVSGEEDVRIFAKCEADEDGAGAKDWSVNGTVGGNGTIGTVAAQAAGTATYTAPSEAPTPEVVAVSAKVSKPEPYTLVSNVTVKDRAPGYAGIASFTTSTALADTVGQVDITWYLVEELPDVRKYEGEGSLTVTVTPASCQPKDVTVSLDPAGTVLDVYTQQAAGEFAETHAFGLLAVDHAETFHCIPPDYAIDIEYPYPALLNPVGVSGNCPGFPVPFADVDLLEGTFSCSLFGLQNLEWSFAAQ